MRGLPDLPRNEPNSALIAVFEPDGVLATPATAYAAGRWELRAHPDLVGRLIDLAPVRSLYSVHGLPCLAAGPTDHAVAAVVAAGTDSLLVRLSAPPDSIAREPEFAGLGARQGWYSVTAWQSADLLAPVVESAYAFAGDLAAQSHHPTPHSRQRSQGADAPSAPAP